MKRTILFLAFFAFTAPAWAQSPQTDPTIEAVGQDWTGVQGSERHLLQSLNDLVKAYQALKVENEKLKADAVKKDAPPN